MTRRTARLIAAASLVAAIPAASQAQAPNPVIASASIESEGTVITIRADTGRVRVETRHGQSRVIGWYDPAEIELWTVAASKLFDVVGATALGSGQVAAPRIVETRTPQLMSADTGAIVLDRVFTYTSDTMNLYASDRGSAHSLYVPIGSDAVRDLLEAMRRAGADARQLAANGAQHATPLAGN
jgi:hypothetical protein